MEYAVQTRDYTRDYRWSWEESGSDSLRAKVSLELQNLIEDGKPGVAVIFREGSYHVIITAIYKLGDKPIGTDFSSANIRLNLVFSQITLEKAKGIVRYYLNNQSNPGVAFSNIVSWSNNRDKWKINEDQIIAAFNSIPEVPASGIVLNCEKGSELQSLLDFDWTQTEGAKYVYQPKSSNPVRIAVDPIPEKPLPPPDPPKISYWKRSLLLFMLLLAALSGLAYQSVNLYQTRKTVDELSERPTNKFIEDLKADHETELKKQEKRLSDANGELTKLYEVTGTNNPDEAIKAISGLQKDLTDVKNQLDSRSRELVDANSAKDEAEKSLKSAMAELEGFKNSFEARLQEAKNRYHDNFKNRIVKDLTTILTTIDETVGNEEILVKDQKTTLKNSINVLIGDIKKSETEGKSDNK